MSAIVWYFEHSLALPFFGIAMKINVDPESTEGEMIVKDRFLTQSALAICCKL